MTQHIAISDYPRFHLAFPVTDLARAMRHTWERMKIVIEPSSAVPLACLLDGSVPVRGKRVGVIISGGNVDLDRLPWMPGAATG